MLTAVNFVLGIAAFAAWVTAVFSALSIVRLAPKGGRLSAYFDLGWWRFAKLQSQLGEAAIPHINRYRFAVLAFFVCVLAAIGVSALAISMSAPA